MQQFRDKRFRVIFAALYALAMTLVAYAHKSQPSQLYAEAAFKAELAAYALPDGTLPVLCLTSGGGGTETGVAGLSCDACLIAGSPGLPAADAGGLDCPHSGPVDTSLSTVDLVVRLEFFRAHAPRAPPVAFKANA